MKTNSSIVFFLSKSLFLGFGVSLLFLEASKDCYIGATIGLLLGLLINIGLINIINKKENRTLKEIFNSHKIIGMLTRILLFLASFLILIYILVIYKIFVTSFLLVNTPPLYVTIPFVAIGAYCAFKGLKVISRVSGTLLPLSVVLSLLTFISLIGYSEITNFLPILTAPPKSLFSSIITFAGISTFPNILTLHFNNNPKGYNKMYILASLIIILTLGFVTGVFGEALVKIFRFPEYMVLKQLKVLNFIEKVENILSITWAFDLFITLSMAIYSMRELIPEKKNKWVMSVILILVLYIIEKGFDFNYINEIKLYYLLPYIAIILPITIMLLMFYLVRKRKKE